MGKFSTSNYDEFQSEFIIFLFFRMEFDVSNRDNGNGMQNWLDVILLENMMNFVININI